MATELKDLSIEEVSLVDAPANKGARVVLMKREKNGGIMDQNTDERVSLLKRMAQYLGVSAPEASPKDEGADDMADEALTKQVAELTKKLDEVTKALSTEKSARETAEKQLADARKAADEDAGYKAFRQKLSPALQKACDEMDEKDRKDFMSRFGKAEDPVAKAVEAVAAEAKKAADALAERDGRIAKLERAERIAKRKADLADLSAVEKFDEFVETVDAVYQKDAAAAEEIVKRMRALAAQAKAGNLFKVAGRDGAGSTGAESRISAAVSKVLAEDPKLTREQAVDKVLKADPSMYEEYLAETKDKE